MFSNSYAEAKSMFIDLASGAGFELKKYVMQNRTGPSGEELSTDVAYHITAKTKKILIVNSGIHGVEGFYGSAMQSQWLVSHSVSDLPEELGIVFIHACNPYGFAYLDRVDQSEVDEHGVNHRVDPNRNFIDFSKPLPVNPGYTQSFEELLIPHDWYGWSKYLSTAKLIGKLIQDKITHTSSHLLNPMMGGQYCSPEGFSYGGNHQSWTNIVIHKIISEVINQKQIEEIAFIDLHTGVGKKGQVEAYSLVAEDADNHIRIQEWLHGIINTISSPYPVLGALATAMVDSFPGKKVTSFAVECGTKNPLTVVNALRAQNWLDKYGEPTQSQEKEIKNAMKSAFCPDDEVWKNKVTDITMKIIQRTLEKLGGGKTVKHECHANNINYANNSSLIFAHQKQLKKERTSPVNFERPRPN